MYWKLCNLSQGCFNLTSRSKACVVITITTSSKLCGHFGLYNVTGRWRISAAIMLSCVGWVWVWMYTCKNAQLVTNLQKPVKFCFLPHILALYKNVSKRPDFYHLHNVCLYNWCGITLSHRQACWIECHQLCATSLALRQQTYAHCVCLFFYISRSQTIHIYQKYI